MEKEADNDQTYREFLLESIELIGVGHSEEDLDKMNDGELNDFLNFCDYLWTK